MLKKSLRIRKISTSKFRIDLTTDPTSGPAIDDDGLIDLPSLMDTFACIQKILPNFTGELDETAARILIGLGRCWSKRLSDAYPRWARTE
jgi:hypothetical protein